MDKFSKSLFNSVLSRSKWRLPVSDTSNFSAGWMKRTLMKCGLWYRRDVACTSQQSSLRAPNLSFTVSYRRALDEDDGDNSVAARLQDGPREKIQQYETDKSLWRMKSFEDHLFNVLSDDNEKVPLSRLVTGIKSSGLRLSDPRLRESLQSLRELQRTVVEEGGKEHLDLDKSSFKECIRNNLVLIRRAFTNDFVIPEFLQFSQTMNELYFSAQTNMMGKVADYIPQLSRFSKDCWGVSVCTIDGQRHSIGDTDVAFCLQSCTKPLVYGLALSEQGPETVHNYVGQEPSGESFNTIKLDRNNKPHNPMINAGAIVVCSLVKNHLPLADRFDFVSNCYRKLAGGEYLGFNNSVFLSERETADRNFALGYYLKENRCFPDGTSLQEVMDFYFQLCSIEVTAESGSVIAATLANGGICPITGDRVLDGVAVRNTLSLMHACGMYDYSGQFAFQVGLPAKSGVSGCVLLVVPNVFGACLWSPPLDPLGNSCRGLQFCSELINRFNFHNYDNLKHTQKKVDPRQRKRDRMGTEIASLLFAAFNGDLSTLRRMVLAGFDMTKCDYDGRTSLHLAAAEGHSACVEFLLNKCNVSPNPRDRWGHTPMDDAMEAKRDETVDVMKRYGGMRGADCTDADVTSQA